MTPVKMETTSDCFAACLASLFECPLNMVVFEGEGPPSPTNYHQFVYSTGHFMLHYPIFAHGQDDALVVASALMRGNYIFAGLTLKGVFHAVIARYNRIVHDPAPIHQGTLYPLGIGGKRAYQAVVICKTM